MLKEVEKDLHIPKDKIIEKGVKYFLEIELRNIGIEIEKLAAKHSVDSFEGLWNKLESGEVSESDCFDDLSKLEFLELEKEKVSSLLKKAE